MASMKVQGNLTARGEEPPMFLQRPSTGKSQDVRHILTRTFRDLYTRDAIGPETVRNLNVSKGGDDPYHERYVESLQKVFEERQRRLDEAAKLEKHIMQAQARAMSADEKELNRVSKSCENYNELGLPPGRSHFRSCIDTDLLRKNKLLTPEDYATDEPSAVPPPPSPKIPSYARVTVSSQQHTRMSEMRDHSPFPPQRTDLEDLEGPTFLSEDFQEGGPESSRVDMEEVTRTKREHGWKIYMSEEQREQDRQDLATLQSKVNYKRNPRFVPPSATPGGRTLIKGYNPVSKQVGIKPDLGDEKKKEPSLIFLLSPPIVKFTNYKSGQVYELTLELKNVSAVLRQCRALPPTTSYFSVGLGQFPGEHGLVAPGMSCHYAIRFAPDSLKDYDDVIRIQTQSSAPILVPLQGRREPPKLTLPKVLDVGYCLVGGYHVAQFIVKNHGGNGRFCVLNRNSWPAHNFKQINSWVFGHKKFGSSKSSVVTNGAVAMPPFNVRPSVVELMKGESGVIEVIFSPKSVRSFTQEMTLICDNCNVSHFMLQGESQKAGVELVSVERGTSDPVPGELTDNTAQHLIRFDDLNPFTYTDRAIIVKNPTNVSLPFQWNIYKPDMSEPEEMEGRKIDRVPDVDSVFSVHPPNGTLPPAGQIEFKITFAPPIVNEFHSVLHMQLQQVPPFSESGSAKSSKAGSSEHGDDENLDDSVSEIILNTDVKESRDYTALEIEVKGSSIPLNVVLHPYAIYIPGQNLVGTTVKKLFAMANHSRSTVTFTWQPCNEKHILEVEPPFGELDPGMAMDMEISITGAEPGKVIDNLYCYVMNLDEPLHLHVEADFKGPELQIEEPDINFGLIRLGQSITKEITLMNKSQIITKWSIQDSPVFSSSDDPMAVSEFTFTPSSGEVQPLGKTKVSIKFTPTAIKSVKRVFEVTVEDGNECNISAIGEVQSPMVCLSSCEICMEDVYKQVPVRYQAVLVNQTLLATEFKWGQVEGEHAKDCEIELDPMTGCINPREEKAITVNFRANRSGEFSDLRIPCFVEGIEAPLYLGLFADVKGLSASYRMSTDGTNTQSAEKLDFGEVLIGTTPKLYLHISNESAISAHYSISADYFIAKPPTPPQDKANRSTRKSLLNKTPNLADPLAKTSAKARADLCQAMLVQGLGASFVALPASGKLQPYSKELIEITAYSDMWGSYTDTINIKVGDLDTNYIPVSMNVIGCPLNFQMTAAKHEQKPVVRFGTHVSGVAPINRSMRINNISPFDIRVDWETYNIVDEDNKILDVMVAFGNAFPPRDTKGTEIIPPWQTPEPIKRMPTDMIPDTADSSPLVSRGHSKYSLRSQPYMELEEDSDSEEEEVELEVKEEENRLKVVSLFYRAHEGVPAQEPYNIKAKQLVIPARGFSNVNITFTPLPTEEVTQEMDCEGYAIAHMSLDKNPDVENKVTRKQGFEVNPLHLDMAAHLKPALLSMECMDEEGMRYRSAMSDLMLDSQGNTHSESFRVMGAILSNHTESPLAFRLISKPPFLLVDLDPSTNREELTKAYVTEFQTLKPQHNLPVKIAFQTTTDLLKYLNDSDHDNIALREQDGKKIDIKDDLVVEFNNGTTQKLPLYATLSVPQMELSKESLDFGVCLVGQRRELQLTISNKTASHCHWRVYQESTIDSSTIDRFSIEPTEGYLEAHITHVSDSKSLLKVYFTAKHSEHYETVFVFRGNLGEESRKLFIRGTGSYDEKHEAILNV
ncbi:deleted in lung and esophageal cancer protein 1-like isoform X2 [Mytilus trossulus]|uniref:deleted in lung and esophageal cancer protein 1-like isoform X2 n=1 Tax=Mytilus trossulus TaxID=6551 RepID=UPI0030069085